MEDAEYSSFEIIECWMSLSEDSKECPLFGAGAGNVWEITFVGGLWYIRLCGAGKPFVALFECPECLTIRGRGFWCWLFLLFWWCEGWGNPIEFVLVILCDCDSKSLYLGGLYSTLWVFEDEDDGLLDDVFWCRFVFCLRFF